MAIDPSGPAFVSYRQSDGTLHAASMAWALRAAGVPVWHDATDLPPGETQRRLEEALASGLSGAVLVVTPEVERSTVVRTVELPRLLELAANPTFTFSIVSTVLAAGTTGLDHQAPDWLLGTPPGTLSGIKQFAVGSDAERAQLARWHARRRLEMLRPHIASKGGEILLDVQTRIPPFAARLDGDLVLRLCPPELGNRRPSRQALDDVAAFAAGLPQLLALGGATTVRVRGGAHLSVAFALGAAMPTPLLGQVHVVDTNEQVWTGGAAGISGGRSCLRTVENRVLSGAASDPLLVYVDLVPNANDAAFIMLRDGQETEFSGVLHVQTVAGDFLAATDAHAVVAELDAVLRAAASRRGTNEVHLLLHTPYTIALLLGRRLNTLRITVYEWEDGPADDGTNAPPRYLPALQIRSGAGGSPVEKVLLPERPESSS